MTASQLIETLSKLPPDCEVTVVQDNDGWCCESSIAAIVTQGDMSEDDCAPYLANLCTGFAVLEWEPLEAGSVELLPYTDRDGGGADIIVNTLVFVDVDKVNEAKRMTDEWNEHYGR